MLDDPGRTERAIIMMVDAAIQSLIRQGYDRRRDRIEIVTDDPTVPMGVSLRGRRIFNIVFEHRDGKLVMDGMWVGRPSWWARLVRSIRGKGAGARASGG